MKDFKVGDKVRFVKRNITPEQQARSIFGSAAWTKKDGLSLNKVYTIKMVSNPASFFKDMIVAEGIYQVWVSQYHFVKARVQ